MSGPRTLDALRSAVGRVLVARGEEADALAVDCHRALRDYPRGRRWYATVMRPLHAGGQPPRWADDTWAVDEGEACALAWGRFSHSLLVDGGNALDARKAAEQRYKVALAAVAAARAVEAGE